jgi:hypothetical protein
VSFTASLCQQVIGILHFIVDSAISMLPRCWRGWWSERISAALVSAFLEATICMMLLFRQYIHLMQHHLSGIPAPTVLKAVEHHGDVGLMGLGASGLLVVLGQPSILLLAYFMVEGAVRVLEIQINQKITGTLPLWLLAHLLRRKGRPSEPGRPHAESDSSFIYSSFI